MTWCRPGTVPHATRRGREHRGWPPVGHGAEDPASRGAGSCQASTRAIDTGERSPPPAADDAPPFRYTAALAGEIEPRWQDRWERSARSRRPTRPARWPSPSGVGGRPKLFVLDMFPYPSGAGLHVGHPLGYIGTDVYGRYQRMTRPQRAARAWASTPSGCRPSSTPSQTGQHPRVTTEENIATYRRQLRRLGLAHDPRRSVATTDAGVLPLDAVDLPADLQLLVRHATPDRARPDRRAGRRAAPPAPGRRPDGRPWATLTPVERRQVVDDHRLAYVAEAPVNWCPGLGTVLANEEVTADGRSDRGNFPVFKRNMRQWMMRITAYADRLIDDLDRLDWPDSIKMMQRNWIGRSEGARRRLRRRGAGPIDGLHHPARHAVRRDLHGAGARAPAGRPHRRRRVARRHAAGVDRRLRDPAEAVDGLPRARPRPRRDVERQVESREKTGVFTGVVRGQPGQRRADPGLHRRLRADGLRHRRDHGRARPGPARLGVRRGASTCRSCARSQPPDGLGRARRTSATARPSTARTTPWTWTGSAWPTPSGP